MNKLELLGTICGIIGVYYSYKNSYWGFVIGLGNTMIYIFICFEGKLYGECVLNFYYTVMNLIGWINWIKKKSDNTNVIAISYCNRKEKWIGLFSLLGLWGIFYFGLEYLTDSTVPFFDAFVVGASYVAMGLLVLRKIENWVLWIIVNIISIGLFYYKGYTITCVQYLVLLAIAIQAYVSWKKDFKNAQTK